ncbi:MAG: PASTA domain-containing protein, partial [Solirubrobacteraceae bacterium]
GEEPGAGTRADKGSTVTLTASNGPGNVSIPSVQGLSRSQASRYLTRAGLKVTDVVMESSSQFKAGEATGTNPGAARTVAAGTAVTLLVSSGAAPKAIPAVTGETQAAATTTLTQAGFNVSPQTVTSSTVTAGNVISQDPAANSSHVPGTTVTIVIAQAPPTVSVPPVTGDPLAGAVGALTTAGFAIHRSTKDVRLPSEDGTVISQSPGAGSTAKKGSTVTIVVGHYVAGSSTSSSTTSSTTSTTSSSTTSSTTTAPASGSASTTTSSPAL